MNYSLIYDQLIHQAQHRPCPATFESHHIIPKSLGGLNDQSNLVKLTLREHFIAHLLLMRIHRGRAGFQAMSFAAYKMAVCHQHHLKITSRQFEQIKLDYREERSKLTSLMLKGIKKTEDHKRKIGDALRGRSRSWTAEWRANITKSLTGKKHTEKRNSEKSNRRVEENNIVWIITTPTGEIVYTDNLKGFCREMFGDKHHSAQSNLRRKPYKGYTAIRSYNECSSK